MHVEVSRSAFMGGENAIWKVVLVGADNKIVCETTFEGPEARKYAEEYAEMMTLLEVVD